MTWETPDAPSILSALKVACKAIQDLGAPESRVDSPMFIDDQLLGAKSSLVGCVGMMRRDSVDHEGVDLRDSMPRLTG
jgi:hypothetical protein